MFGSSPFGSSPFGSSFDGPLLYATNLGTSSRSRIQNVENFFWKNPFLDNTYFDEAKETVRDVDVTNTSRIDTSGIDGYRQGVELTSWKHYDAGTAKIFAGEEGHRLKQQIFGLNHVYYSDKAFKDGGGVDPAQFIGATSSVSRQVTAQPYISVPPPTELSSLEFDRYLYDGVIDFLGARRRDVMLRTVTPVDTRGVRGEIQDGNIDEAGGTNQVVTVYEWDVSESRVRPFFDDPLLLDGRWSSTVSTTPQMTGSRVSRFVDNRLLRNAQTSSTTYPSEMIDALSLMTGSTDNFISVKTRAAVAGWDYSDSTVAGTDSIAFGGMTY